MLFKGVRGDRWEEAKERAGSVEWREVVGVREQAEDPSVLRVLEWGGMEVLCNFLVLKLCWNSGLFLAFSRPVSLGERGGRPGVVSLAARNMQVRITHPCTDN